MIRSSIQRFALPMRTRLLGVSVCMLAHVRSVLLRKFAYVRSAFRPENSYTPAGRALCKFAQPVDARFSSSFHFPLYLYCRDSSKRCLADGANLQGMRQVCDFFGTAVGKRIVSGCLLQMRRQRRGKRRSFCKRAANGGASGAPLCALNMQRRETVSLFFVSQFSDTLFPSL